MKKIKIVTILLLALCSMGLHAQTATEILRKTDEVMYSPKDQSADVKIILTDKRGNRQEREARYIQQGSDKRLFKFTAPASQRGIAFLSLPDDVIYIYLPAYEKERRIASHVKNQSFAGTDFSYDDMESKPLAEEYDPVLISQTDEVWKLKLVPKPGTQSDYSRLEMEIGKDNLYMRKVEYYDRGGQKMKQLENRKLKKINGYWTATEIEMRDLQREHSTLFISNNILFDSNLSDDEFTVRRMKQ
ncbi:MAG: outer membrane lipoprotein-sorting protein [Bacteroidales bacterium]|nr:outer membrane lipoprotein-sorting protein [Bacteroidales bacterium]